ncbi:MULTISPECIES: hypothetical protein [unclassified Sphingobacterium]|uniref:hypothetical protein n=1 Tax=unclassified Sphingobacterium TaxID=2609468 RepID=UPI0025D3F0B6|nr:MULTISPECIES: hypothetical protein [unclassified Sphingobacterium]
MSQDSIVAARWKLISFSVKTEDDAAKYTKMTVHDKRMGMKGYHLYSKNGLTLYVFRKS